MSDHATKDDVKEIVNKAVDDLSEVINALAENMYKELAEVKQELIDLRASHWAEKVAEKTGIPLPALK